jgi:D-arabinose 1-dehydrogenase-like Zn-dependent alcohol dehydrogenase
MYVEDTIMTTPAVVLTADCEIALDERLHPTLRPDQVIVGVDVRGICGSDLHSVQCSAFDSRHAGLIMKALIAPKPDRWTTTLYREQT